MFGNDIELDVRPRDLFKKLSLQAQKIDLDIQVPDSFYQTLLEQVMERDFLNDISEKIFLPNKNKIRKINWMQLTRLPIHPNENDNYDLLSRWQVALSSFHIWNYRLLFLLLRNEGETKIFLGTVSSQQNISNEDALEQMKEATFGSMPGMGLEILNQKYGVLEKIIEPLQKMNSIGAITGIPSFREEDKDKTLQTLDSLAFGLRDGNGFEKDYALLVIADPINDQGISDLISRYRRLGSQIHTAVKRSASQSLSRGELKEGGAKAVGGVLVPIIGGLIGTFLGNPIIGTRIGGMFGGAIGGGLSKQVSVNGSASINTEYLDKFAEYAEQVTEHHIKRLNDGRMETTIFVFRFSSVTP